MDPVMKATRSFLAEMELMWNRGPEAAVRMVADADDRGAVIKALRLAELSPENTRPLILVEAPFAEQSAYFAGLAEAIEAGRAAPREGGAAENGLAFTLALVPTRIDDAARYRAGVEAILAAPFGERIRIAIFDPGGLTLGRILERRQARFHVDAAALGAFLDQLGQRGSLGPGAAEGPRRSLLRDHLSAAVRATEKGCRDDALAHFRAARAICRVEGRTLEEATVLMALAGVFLAGKTPTPAMTAYEDAAAIAVKANAWALASQASMGAGGVAMSMDWYRDADTSYRRAAEAAQRACVPELLDEANRMVGVCRQLAERAPKTGSPELPW